jgi:hypothetical protein
VKNKFNIKKLMTYAVLFGVIKTIVDMGLDRIRDVE